MQGLARRAVDHFRHPQHRDAYFLMLNTVVGAAAGIVFWLLLARVGAVPPAAIGTGYAIIGLGTVLGVLGKGGFDTALLRAVPHTSRSESRRLLLFACVCAAALVLALAAVAAAVAKLPFTPIGWVLVAASGALLATTWLQDAYFLAEGDARFSFLRNLVLSGARILLPLLAVAVVAPEPAAMAWTVALLLSALAAVGFGRRIPDRDGPAVPRRVFVRSAARNLTGAAAEFLPGYLLAPIVLAVAGAASAAYFGMAWQAASMLFLASAAISRSALARMVRDPSLEAECLGRATRQNLLVVAPGALLLAAAAPWALAVFGPGYSSAAPTLAVLALSAAFVAPTYLYLALLRARERPGVLVAFPAAMVVALALLAPPMAAAWGLPGVAFAWLAANAPFGAWATFRLLQTSREVKPIAATVDRHPHAE